MNKRAYALAMQLRATNNPARLSRRELRFRNIVTCNNTSATRVSAIATRYDISLYNHLRYTL
jgi:hypothetical protein